MISFSREVFPPIELKVKGANMGEMKKFLDKTVKRRYLLGVPFFLLVDRSWQVILQETNSNDKQYSLLFVFTAFFKQQPATMMMKQLRESIMQ